MGNKTGKTDDVIYGWPPREARDPIPHLLIFFFNQVFCMHEVKYLRDQNGWRASNLLDPTQLTEYMSVTLVRVKGGKTIIH